MTPRKFTHGAKIILKQDQGATIVEYALMLGLIALVCFAAVQLLGANLATFFTAVANGLP